jgi:hypothetical protein
MAHEENFQQLLNWKAAAMEKPPDNMIELDVHMVGGNMYFHHFLCTWTMYLGFLRGLSAISCCRLNGLEW